MTRSTKIFCVALLITISLTLISCGSTTTNVVSCHTTTAQAQEIKTEVEYSGVLNTFKTAVISSQLAGHVVAVNVDEGSKVKADQALIELDKQDLTAQLEQAQTNIVKSKSGIEQAQVTYNNALLDYKRNQELFNEGTISQKQLETYKAALDISKSNLDMNNKGNMPASQATIKTIQLNLAKTTITSPISGIIANKNVNMGENINPGTPLLTIVNIDNLILTVNVSEDLLPFLQEGSKVKVMVDSMNNKALDGSIKFISPIAISTGQFFPVEILLNNTQGQLKAGMTAHVHFSLNLQASLAIPNEAILTQNGKNYVYIAENNIAKKVSVDVGIKGDTYTWIKSGILKDTPVITDQLNALIDGIKVNIVK
jgi:RND family efflux transporter MFP subunit